MDYYELYSEIARKQFGIGHMYIYTFLLKMTNTVTSQNMDLSLQGHPVYRAYGLQYQSEAITGLPSN
jgi:hypothetical protein